ncbi:TraG family conjugative transposon ATPase, partial [Bacteroides caccae]|uniref:TraG family conjugative transposon ATPase n=1 Tax=Bacteroides caccae TaxID=47678 RepID=UPI0022E47536
DITVAFRVELPELFTVTSAEYEAIHSAWYKAIKVLPDYSIVHKQDFFIKENYQPDTERDELSFLSRSFERHFNERPFLNHYCYLFLTKTTRERSRRQSDFSTLCRGRIVPQEIADKEAAAKFIEAVGQFERIMNDSGFVTLTRLAASEITGQDGKAGIIEKYFSLSQTDTTCLKDIGLYPEEMRVGDDILCLHTLSDVEDLPGKVGTDCRFEKLSTDRSDCRLSFAAPVGVLFIDDHAENLKNFEQTARNMQSLSRYSRANQVNKEWIDEYLNEAHSRGLISVRCHCNVMAWSDDREELKRIRNDVGSQLALMECKPRHNTVDTPTLFCTNYKSSLSPFGIKMVDRVSGRPLHIDISDLPMKKGITTNRNKFILGPSGSGKSFFTNHMVRQYYEQGAHVLLVDTGNSYLGLSQLIHNRTHGEDGIYFTYTNE